jgi:hypothetical protein
MDMNTAEPGIKHFKKIIRTVFRKLDLKVK